MILCVWQETLVPQCDPGDTEMVCTWRGKNCPFKANPQPPCLVVSELCSQRWALMRCISPLHPAGGDNSLFNSPAQSTAVGKTEEEEGPSQLPPYSRLTWHMSTLQTGCTHPSSLHSRENSQILFSFMENDFTLFFLNYACRLFSVAGQEAQLKTSNQKVVQRSLCEIVCCFIFFNQALCNMFGMCLNWLVDQRFVANPIFIPCQSWKRLYFVICRDWNDSSGGEFCSCYQLFYLTNKNLTELFEWMCLMKRRLYLLKCSS